MLPVPLPTPHWDGSRHQHRGHRHREWPGIDGRARPDGSAAERGGKNRSRSLSLSWCRSWSSSYPSSRLLSHCRGWSLFLSRSLSLSRSLCRSRCRCRSLSRRRSTVGAAGPALPLPPAPSRHPRSAPSGSCRVPPALPGAALPRPGQRGPPRAPLHPCTPPASPPSGPRRAGPGRGCGPGAAGPAARGGVGCPQHLCCHSASPAAILARGRRPGCAPLRHGPPAPPRLPARPALRSGKGCGDPGTAGTGCDGTRWDGERSSGPREGWLGWGACTHIQGVAGPQTWWKLVLVGIGDGAGGDGGSEPLWRHFPPHRWPRQGGACGSGTLPVPASGMG